MSIKPKLCAVPISAEGNGSPGDRTLGPALTDQPLGSIALASLMRASRTHFCAFSLLWSLATALAATMRPAASDLRMDMDLSSVRCLSPLEASLMGGIEPPFAPAIRREVTQSLASLVPNPRRIGSNQQLPAHSQRSVRSPGSKRLQMCDPLA
jgi:hypothetical protein